MSVSQLFKVQYHFEVGGKKATEDYVDYVGAADGTYNSIKTALVTNNSKQRGPGSLVIDAVVNVGVPSFLQ